MSLPTRQRTGEEEAPKERFVVGIDYGTTFTSVAYACVPANGIPFAGANRLDIQSILLWPGRAGIAEVPTKTIYYNDENNDRQLEWGFGTQTLQMEARGLTACHPISLAKLLLHSSHETDEETQSIRRYAAEIPRTGKELVEDFLARLYDHLFRDDARDPGFFSESEPDLMKRFKESEIEFVIGVPAAWTEQEQIDMVAAAGRAGFQNASRVSEPEAVATEFFADEAYKGRLEVSTVPMTEVFADEWVGWKNLRYLRRWWRYSCKYCSSDNGNDLCSGLRV
jgi:molecular chaperone DnaK (HSP70)